MTSKQAAKLAAALCLIGTATWADPLFDSSVTSNDIDFIHSDDPSAFHCLTALGASRQEMPDKRNDQLFVDNVQAFSASFTDGTTIEIWTHPDLGARAETVARQLTGPLGRLPSFMRGRLNHVVVHAGDETAFEEAAGGFFVVYDANMAKRIATNDLEETVFHEATHVTLDPTFGKSRPWVAAQRGDGVFVTAYAAANPEKEDVAETALFAMTYFQHPDRLPDDVLDWLTQNIPNRLAAFETMFGPGKSLQRPPQDMPTCPG